MKSFVLDTSAAISWYLEEEFSLKARKWQRELLAETIEIYVPELHYLEFSNVLRTYVRRGELESELAEDIYSTHLIAPLKPTSLDRSSLLSTALEYDSTCYDAAFILLATSLNAPIITAERTTTPWVVKLDQLIESVL